MKRQNIYVELVYLLLIGATLGAVLVLGAVVAATIFHTENMPIALNITHYEQGLIMGEIFRRFSYFSYFMAFVIAMYEVMEYRNLRRDRASILASFVSVSTMLLFSGVYVPKILHLQSIGVEATMSENFRSLHMASEIDFKILAIALTILFIRRVTLLRTIKA